MDIKAIIEEHSHRFLHGLKAEYDGDKKAGSIIISYVKTGEISVDDEHLLKNQFTDSLKIIGIGVPFALVPGASILIPLLIKEAEKHNIELMPSAFIDPDKDSEKQG